MIQPDYVSFQPWAQSFILESGLDVPDPPAEEHWFEWACEAIKQSDPISGLPRPDFFNNWREWAYRIYEQFN